MSKKLTIDETLTPFGIGENLTDFDTSKYHVLCVAYAETVSYIKGSENAPLAIIKASEQVELFDLHTQSEPYLKGISMSEINTDTNIKELLKMIEEEITQCLKFNKFTVMLGGEHSISHGAIMACKNQFKELCILQIDAHSDLKEHYLNDPFSHACAMRHAINENIPLTQIGIRSLDREEFDFIMQNRDKIATFFAGPDKIRTQEILNSLKHKNVYLTIDLDGFDPSVIPHLGTPEPGGLEWYEVIDLLKELFKSFNVVAADIVELAPSEYSTPSDFTAAKLLYKLFSLKN